MFEEEAEEYADNTRIKDKNTYISFPDESISEVQDFEGNYIDISERIIKTFKDASEFGYNKAKKEMQEIGLALQSDMDKTIEQNLALKKELKKANEWHYVNWKYFADKDYPKSETASYLVQLRNKDVFICEWETEEGFGSFYDSNLEPIDNDDIYAWKEIVLPKESEIESEMFPEITLPKGSAEFVDKVIADAEKKLKESE